MGKFFSLVWVKRTVRTVLVTASSFLLAFVVNGSVNASAKDLAGAWELIITIDPDGFELAGALDPPQADAPPRTSPPALFSFADGTVTRLDEGTVGLGAYTLLSGNPRNPSVEDVYEFVYIIDWPSNREYPTNPAVPNEFGEYPPDAILNFDGKFVDPPNGRGFFGCPDEDKGIESPTNGQAFNDPSCMRTRAYYLITLSAEGDFFTAKGCFDSWMSDSLRNPNRDEPPVFCEENLEEWGQRLEFYQGSQPPDAPRQLFPKRLFLGFQVGTNPPVCPICPVLPSVLLDPETATINATGTRITP